MISERDQPIKYLIDGFAPCWNALRVKKNDFFRLETHGFTTEAILFVGQPSLLCGVESKDFPESTFEYFHIHCDTVDEGNYSSHEWITFAAAGGASNLDRKLQWLFETPSLALTEGVEEFRDGVGPDANKYEFAFYNGLKITDPKGRGSRKLTVSDMPDLVMAAEFSFRSGLS